MQDYLSLRIKKQLKLGKLDDLNRATYGHIQLKSSDTPTKKRNKKINTNPVGWHNYKFYYGGGQKKAWLMNRGHLIGYQFSGLNDEKKNLVPMTSLLNAGNYKGTDTSNIESLFYYEKRLDSWLDSHKNYYLDYKVTPIYTDKELIPRHIEIQYVGIDSKGNLLEIDLDSVKESVDDNKVTHVILNNRSSNAEINYLDGTAKNTVFSAKKQKEEAHKEEVRKAEEAKKAEEERQRVEAEQAAQKAEEERQRVEAETAQKAEEEKQRVEAETAQRAEEERQRVEAEQAAQQVPKGLTVYIAPQSGTKYHYNSNCRGLNRANSISPMIESDAIANRL